MASVILLGQTPSFEVASVKAAAPSTDGRFMVSLGGDPGRVNYTNVNLRVVLPRAFGVKSFQISGPSWLDTERYDIVAKIPDNTPKEQIPMMLQALLMERFKLKLHRETKELPVYALTVAKNGPKLKKAEDDTAAPGRGMMMFRGGHLELKRTTVSGFAEMLSNMLDRPVLDLTNIPGSYDVDLDVSKDELDGMKGGMTRMGPPGVGPDGPIRRADGPAPDSAPAASIFTSVQQLGLKLEPRKAPIEMIVIDSGERIPTEN